MLVIFTMASYRFLFVFPWVLFVQIRQIMVAKIGPFKILFFLFKLNLLLSESKVTNLKLHSIIFNKYICRLNISMNQAFFMDVL